MTACRHWKWSVAVEKAAWKDLLLCAMSEKNGWIQMILPRVIELLSFRFELISDH